MKLANRCAKQNTVAIIAKDDKFWVGSNWCQNPQDECPRKDLPTGAGYEMCIDICKQNNHAEIDACKEAGENARGATLYLFGHTYCCDNCLGVMKECGVKSYVINGVEHYINK